jgi:GNAT superfamily N-acetyltransferase
MAHQKAVADFPDLFLTHPFPSELPSLFDSTAPEWRGALAESQYIEQCIELVLLDSVHPPPNLVHSDWILVDNRLPVAERKILSSCETFRKRVLIQRPERNVEEKVVYGIASVFTAPEFRRKGYARRMLLDLAEFYKKEKCAGTLLFSDIGKKFYGEMGWKPLPGNSHIDFASPNSDFPVTMVVKEATPLFEADLEKLCKEDEEILRNAMDRGPGVKTKMVIVPDYKHMAWHHMREEFVIQRLWGAKAPNVKGAMAGEPGKRVWMIWTRKYDFAPDDTEAGNMLYVLRLVIENADSGGGVPAGERDEVKENLGAVIERAQKEAKEWRMSGVRLWGPSPLVRELVKEMAVSSWEWQREVEGIASLMLNEGVSEDEIEWLANERYAWC